MVKTLTVRLPVELAEVLETVARTDGIPVAEAIRSAIDAHIESRRRDSAFQVKLQVNEDRIRNVHQKLAPT